jgi:formylglycine-generating enzyme required for sulfatase activity
LDSATVKKQQQASADDLGVSAEITNSIGMRLALIPAGKFSMGSPESEEDHRDSEYQHQVWITKAFYLGVYEVTQEEYERVMRTNPSYFSAGGSGKGRVSGMDTSRFPVEGVSWEDAVEYCRKLSALPAESSAGRDYRLPTEAEWEYACRAGTTTPFHFGLQLNGREANCNAGYPNDPDGTDREGPYLGRTTTVGSYQPNAFGLYDMHGNVWEWCQDFYKAEYYRRSPLNDPQGPASVPSWVAPFRVFRGGGWAHNACRAAHRDWSLPQYRREFLGFRVAAVPLGGQLGSGK